MQRERINICAISKTQIFPNAPFNPCGFAKYRQNRLYTSGGGVTILIKRGIQHHLIALPALQGEAVCVTLNWLNSGAHNCNVNL
jgi:hypothetical protein